MRLPLSAPSLNIKSYMVCSSRKRWGRVGRDEESATDILPRPYGGGSAATACGPKRPRGTPPSARWGPPLPRKDGGGFASDALRRLVRRTWLECAAASAGADRTRRAGQVGAARGPERRRPDAGGIPAQPDRARSASCAAAARAAHDLYLAAQGARRRR